MQNLRGAIILEVPQADFHEIFSVLDQDGNGEVSSPLSSQRPIQLRVPGLLLSRALTRLSLWHLLKPAEPWRVVTMRA